MAEYPRINGYECPVCKKITVTIDIDDGVTPFILDCRMTPGCQGMARSMFYPRDPFVLFIVGPPTWEWYRPSLSWAKGAGPDMLEHVKKGGLNIRPITEAGKAKAKGGSDGAPTGN